MKRIFIFAAVMVAWLSLGLQSCEKKAEPQTEVEKLTANDIALANQAKYNETVEKL